MDVNLQNPSRGAQSAARTVRDRIWRGLWGMFNLNDPRWGRGGDDAPRNEGGKDGQDEDRNNNHNQRPQPPRGQGPNQGPPDLEEVWRDLNRKLGSLFGGRGSGGWGGASGGGGGGFQPDMKNAGFGIGAVIAITSLIDGMKMQLVSQLGLNMSRMVSITCWLRTAPPSVD